MKFPVTIRRWGSEAKIYAPAKKFAYYRVAHKVAGKRRMRTFATYPEARQAAEHVLKDLAQGSQSAGLTASQSRDTLAALERLQGYYQTTGRRVSLLSAVSQFAESATKLQGRTVAEAVDGYLSTIASIQRKDLSEAVEEFIIVDQPRTRAVDGKRAQLSAKYAYNRTLQLRRFAATFPATVVCDLTRPQLDTFIGGLADFAPKTRNHFRASIRQFLQWAVRKDYLTGTHRMGEADGLRPELANTAEIDFYTPKELTSLLAVGALAGLRTAELLRLDWADVWRVSGHIEITAGKSKTRSRRLVEVVPALAAWLEPFRDFTEGKLWKFHEITYQEYFGEICHQAKITRKANGLRHAFCTYHFALHANENQTAAQAGNSPAMIHGHYKGLATKAEGGNWFAVSPVQATNIIAFAPSTQK